MAGTTDNGQRDQAQTGLVEARRMALRRLGGAAGAGALVAWGMEAFEGTALAATSGSLFWSPSYAGLRGQAGTAFGVAFAGGRLAPGDGGAGLFVWDPAGAATDDGGTTLTVTGATGNWQRVRGAFVSVRWFGDDNLAAAVAAVGAASAVLIVDGTCTVGASLSIPANVTVEFVGTGTFDITAGAVVTIAGPVRAPKSRIFSGAGQVAFGDLVDRVYPEWWDGVDAVRIQAAIDTGKNVLLSGTYDLGTTTEQAHRYLTIFDKHHQKIIGTNQAALVCTTQQGSVDLLPGRIIHIEGSSFIEIDNIHFEDLGVTDTSYLTNRNGAAGINMTVTAADAQPPSQETANISLRNLSFKHLVHAVVFNRDDLRVTPRIHAIQMDNIRSDHVRYGISCQYNGDHLVVRNFATYANQRDYIVFAVQNHDIEMYSIQAGSNGDTYVIDVLGGVDPLQQKTERIRLRVRAEDKLSSGALVSVGIGQTAPSPNRLVADIDLDIDMRDADMFHRYSPGTISGLVEFRSATGDIHAGAEDTTINRWENIRIRGVDVNQNTPIRWVSKPTVKVGVELSPLTYHFARLDNADDANISRRFGGCYLTSGQGRRIYFSQGKLSDNPISIDLGQFSNQNSVIQLRVWASRGDKGVDATGAMTYREDNLFVYVGSGYIIIWTQNPVFNTFYSATPSAFSGDGGVTYTTSGTNLIVNFPLYNGDTDDGAAAVEVAMY